MTRHGGPAATPRRSAPVTTCSSPARARWIPALGSSGARRSPSRRASPCRTSSRSSRPPGVRSPTSCAARATWHRSTPSMSSPRPTRRSSPISRGRPGRRSAASWPGSSSRSTASPMSLKPATDAVVHAWLDDHRSDLIELVRSLVAVRSENRPPVGEEGPGQAFVAEYLRELGLSPDVFEPSAVAGAVQHAAWWPGRDYAGRPNVVGRLPGRGGGRSLLFSGHVDVVPALGSGAFGFWAGEVADGHLYGRGAGDRKGGGACSLHALR